MKTKFISRSTVFLICALIMFSFSFSFLLNLNTSSAWLHVENINEGDFEIGIVDFWFYNLNNHNVPMYINAKAPTRFFVTGNRPPVDPAFTENSLMDPRFNEAATVHQVTGSNKGDVNINVDLIMRTNEIDPDDYSNVDNNSLTDERFFYVLVPMDFSDPNFTTTFLYNKDYKTYLYNLFTQYGYNYDTDLNTVAGRRAAFNSMNTAQLNKIKNVKIARDAINIPICYILFWQEYDTVGWMEQPYTYKYAHYPLMLNAYVYQDYMS